MPHAARHSCHKTEPLCVTMSLSPTWGAGSLETGWPQQPQMPTDGRLLPPGSHVTRTNPPVTTQLAPSSPTSHDAAQESAREEEATEEYFYCGYDLKPVLPPALAVSVVVRSICLASVQIPLLCRLQTWSQAENPLTGLEA